jgi:pimeloyl-ACP methyl ester carboxylesterase
MINLDGDATDSSTGISPGRAIKSLSQRPILFWLAGGAMGLVLAGFAFGLYLYFRDSAPKRPVHRPEQAFIDSQIPPGLAPRYFPPNGFTWSGFSTEGLPEARYGVAAPPSASPSAQVLIIADADFPGEAYFELANTLIKRNYSVWIIEAPGQGGAGRFPQQKTVVDTPDFTFGARTVKAFIDKVIHPNIERPLYVLASGSGALSALDLNMGRDQIKGMVLINPHVSDPSIPAGEWHRENVPDSYLARIGHQWQTANPDLRLREKSPVWASSASKTQSRLEGLQLEHMLSLSNAPPIRMLTHELKTDNDKNPSKALCGQALNCRLKSLKSINNPSEIIDEIDKIG